MSGAKPIQNRQHMPLGLIEPYACGTLGPAAHLAVGLHLEHCGVCKEASQQLDAIGGALLDALPVEADTADEAIFARLLMEIEQEPAAAPRHAEADPDAAHLPEALQSAFHEARARRPWAFAGPGLRTLDLEIAGSTQAGETPQLLKIQPGHGSPRHGHSGVELTLVLHGAFKDRMGVFGPGDLAICYPGVSHRPVAEPGPTCIAFAVTMAPLKFEGLTGIAQRLFSWRR